MDHSTFSRRSSFWRHHRLILALTLVILLITGPSCLSSGGSSTTTAQPTIAITAAGSTATASVSSPGSTTSPTSASGNASATPSATAGTDAGSSSPTATTTPATPVTAADLANVQIGLTPIFKGLNQPLYLTDAGDGSGDIYIVEKGGTILVAQNDQIQSPPFLDITSRVKSTGSEQGLLGLAFDPSFASNGYFYVDYIDTNGNTVIGRFTAASDHKTVDPNSFKQLLGIQQPFSNHNGGQLLFGPDGMLWIGVGDGGSAGDPNGNAQNPSTLLGSILRIDVDHGDPYAIPSDNPFANGQNGKPEVWAYGLRNPWRFSFDRATQDLYIGDVGQANWEEIDFVPATPKPGLNFGWNIMEGLHCYSPSSNCDKSGLTLPVTEYSHASGNCSVTGGYAYHGSQFASIEGVYFFGDYCSGTIWALTKDATGNWTKTEVLQGPGGLSSFGQDGTGELYVCNLGTGTVYHLTATSK